jgi:hypothetical protein
MDELPDGRAPSALAEKITPVMAAMKLQRRTPAAWPAAAGAHQNFGMFYTADMLDAPPTHEDI